jgi:hypothetical protein
LTVDTTRVDQGSAVQGAAERRNQTVDSENVAPARGTARAATIVVHLSAFLRIIASSAFGAPAARSSSRSVVFVAWG